MANHSPETLDLVYHALANRTRRAVIAQLGEGPASVSELAQPHDMALPSFLKHLDVLERAGLIVTEKKGRVRTCTLNPERLRPAESWLAARKRMWSTRLDGLANLLTDIKTGAHG